MTLALILALNFAISWLNCWSIGGIWAESKALGGMIRLLAWCGAIQSAIGFSSVFGFLLGAIAVHFHYLPPRAAAAAASLWYLLIIVPALGSGLIITIQSWIIALRERSLLNMGSAAWNTYAQIHNMAGAIDGIGDAFSNVVDFLFPKDSKDSNTTLALLVIALVMLALASGVIMTAVLIKHYAGRLPMPARDRRFA
ncbi:hypothetical protein [Paraburkholderia caribensis]|uniref:hypothetical protein n=1 Tax=Paraburkholderia caribensis TaxID=75105 RepID=UPI002864E7D1|nr:hypothetical protein [Paraburkholderia caribensis]MDR6381809.1 hypothetical protein [Paraburkholderia caribensis]